MDAHSSNKVMAIIEHRRGRFKKISYETIACGRQIADAFEAELFGVIFSWNQQWAHPLKAFGQFGLDRVLCVRNPVFSEFLTDHWIDAATKIFQRERPRFSLMGSTICGRDLAARIGARLNIPVEMNCEAINFKNKRLEVVRSIKGGDLLVWLAVNQAPALLTIRHNCFPIQKSHRAVTTEILNLDVDPSEVKLIETREQPDVVDLTEADVVIGGGRGMGGPDFTILESLARQLNGVVGASRSAVDLGWRPYSEQIGQTGKTISPNLYIACGISGAPQHLAGIHSAKFIVAINQDPEAPIFKHCDYGVVGDLFDIIPRLSEKLTMMDFVPEIKIP